MLRTLLKTVSSNRYWLFHRSFFIVADSWLQTTFSDSEKNWKNSKSTSFKKKNALAVQSGKSTRIFYIRNKHGKFLKKMSPRGKRADNVFGTIVKIGWFGTSQLSLEYLVCQSVNVVGNRKVILIVWTKLSQ